MEKNSLLTPITPRQRLYNECRQVKIRQDGREVWNRKATIATIRAHPQGRVLFPELFDTELNPND